MGKDKYENEDLIKYGHPEDVWFHVDDLSSAHVYLRQKPGQLLTDISDELLLDCAALVKANSIEGCKKSKVYVVYTRWKNLKKTGDMVDGQIGFHRPDNVKRTCVEKNNPIVKQIEKTKSEIYPNPRLAEEQQHRLKEITQEKKKTFKEQLKKDREVATQLKKEKEERSYDRIMKDDAMVKNSEVNQTAEEFEDDFF
jgi:hypothetical protein